MTAAAERDQGVTDLPADVVAMLSEVAGIVLEDWALERGWEGFHDDFRVPAMKVLTGAMERAARSDSAAFTPLAELPPDVLRSLVRAWAEPGLLRALNEVASELVVIG